MKKGTSKGVIVVGSARADGNTGLVVRQFASLSDYDIIDLNTLQIGYFDYQQPVRDDDFMSTIETILQYDVIVFATPVYWYSMSAVMKTFFDRISDLLKWHKDTGRRLRGKSMALISTSEKQWIEPVFAFPFEQTASYLGMHFVDYLHCPTSNSKLTDASLQLLDGFVRKLESKRPAQTELKSRREPSQV